MGNSPSSLGYKDPKGKRGRGRPATDSVVIEVFHRLLDWDVPTARAAVLCKLPKRGKPKKQPEALGRNLQVKLLADRKSTPRTPSVAPYAVARADWKNIPDSALRVLAHTGNRSGKFERMVAAHYLEMLSMPGAPDADYWTRRSVAAGALRASVALSEKALWAFMENYQRATEAASIQVRADQEAYEAREPQRRVADEAFTARMKERGLAISSRPKRIPIITEQTAPVEPWTLPDPDEYLAASERSWGRPSKRAETPEWLLEAWDRRHGKR